MGVGGGVVDLFVEISVSLTAGLSPMIKPTFRNFVPAINLTYTQIVHGVTTPAAVQKTLILCAARTSRKLPFWCVL